MTSPDRIEPAQPLLIVIATGPQDYREYLFSSLGTRYRVFLLHTAPASWEEPYLVGSQVVPDFTAPTLVAAARQVHRQSPVSGVLCWDEARIHATAYVAADLGLPGGDPDAIERCRDKHLGRLALAAAGVRQPRSALVGDVAAALDAARAFGYPVVLKPRAAAASYGVVLVHDDAELRERYAFAHEATVPEAPRHPEPVLVEEYVDGPEISVDSVVARGRVTPVFVAHKEVGFPPYFEETGHVVAHSDPLLEEPDLRDVLDRAHAALGFRDGWTHTEFKLTPGTPTLIEVNGRLGGDLIPYLGYRASGIDPGLLAAAAATGGVPEVHADRTDVAAVRFFYPARPETVIRSVSFDADRLPPEVDRAVPLAAPGSRVSPPPAGLVSGRVAFATVVAGSATDCRAALDRAGEALRLVVDEAVVDEAVVDEAVVDEAGVEEAGVEEAGVEEAGAVVAGSPGRDGR